MSEVTLGVHCSAQPDGQYAADGNIGIVVEGTPVFAVAQERISRRKYDGGFVEAARYALDAVGLSVTDVRTVAVSTFGRPDAPGDPEQQAVADLVRGALGDGPRYQVVPSHHLAHAVSAVAQCGYDRALVAVIDNEGSILGRRTSSSLWRHPLERTSYYLFDGDALTLVARDHAEPGEVGYGKAYSKVTRYLGFRSYQESGKTMALAAFGDRDRFNGLRMFEDDANDQPHTLLRNSENGLRDLADFFVNAGVPLPPPRQPGERFDPRHLDLAAWCQSELEDSVSRRVRKLAGDSGLTAVCGAGGVFLNSVMNRRLQDAVDTADVFVPPSPGDQGLALGAAAWSLWQSTGHLPRWNPQPYLGGQFDEGAILTDLARHDDLVRERVKDAAADAARELAAGRIVGWFQGRSEYGPRALGNRSILANPAHPWSREILNNLVKHREWFRPYAPVAVERSAADTFVLRSAVPFMMHIAPVREHAVGAIPSGVHVDGSARLQTVSEHQNPDFHGLIELFRQLTGIPAVLNTSLNVDGMPIVESPGDAIECLRRSPGMDAIFIGPFKVTRNEKAQS
jgi:carbamoyltransferase